LLQPFAWFDHHAGVMVAVVVGIRLARRRLLPDWAAAAGIVAYFLSTVAARPIYLAARNLPRMEVAASPGLRFGTSLTILAVLIALFALSRAGPARTMPDFAPLPVN
jgi:hypothetical protein